MQFTELLQRMGEFALHRPVNKRTPSLLLVVVCKTTNLLSSADDATRDDIALHDAACRDMDQDWRAVLWRKMLQLPRLGVFSAGGSRTERPGCMFLKKHAKVLRNSKDQS